MSDLDALEAVAKAATPGEWTQGKLGDPLGRRHCVDFGLPPKAPFVTFSKGNAGTGASRAFPASGVVHSDDGSNEANAAHVAAFDPPTVLALIAQARAAEALAGVLGGALKLHPWPTSIRSNVLSALAAYTAATAQPEQASCPK